MRFWFHLADIGDVQSVAVAPEGVPVVLPSHPAVFQPAKALEHTLGEDDVHILDLMFMSPDIGDGFLSAEIQNPVEVYLMHHSLDIGQADLKRGVDSAAAKCPVYHLCVSFGNEALPVKAGDGYIHPSLHPVILPGAVLRAVILHGDDRDIPGCHHRIVHHNDTVGLIDIDPVQPHTAGEHQPIVGVEFAELAVADGHVHLDAAAHLVAHILTEKRQFALAAHAVGALEGEIAAHPSSQI